MVQHPAEPFQNLLNCDHCCAATLLERPADPESLLVLGTYCNQYKPASSILSEREGQALFLAAQHTEMLAKHMQHIDISRMEPIEMTDQMTSKHRLCRMSADEMKVNSANNKAAAGLDLVASQGIDINRRPQPFNLRIQGATWERVPLPNSSRGQQRAAEGAAGSQDREESPAHLMPSEEPQKRYVAELSQADE